LAAAEGDLLAGGDEAAGRRVGGWWVTEGPNDFTEEGWQLFDASIRWALGPYDPAQPFERTYAYDDDGRLTQTAGPDGATDLGYDTRGRLASIDQPNIGTFQYGYDDAGRITDITDPAGRVTTNAYDLAGRLTSMTQTGFGTTGYSWDDDGRLLSETLPSTDVRSWDYSPTTGLLATYTDPTTGATSLGYDGLGRLTTETIGGSTTTYSYDAADQLVTAANAGPGGVDYTWTWDELGRLAQETRDGVVTSHEYDAADQLFASTAAGVRTTVAHDAGGRRINSIEGELGYDLAGQLVRQDTGTDTLVRDYGGLGQLSGIVGKWSQQSVLWWDVNGPVSRPVAADGGDIAVTNGPAGVVGIQSAAGIDEPTRDPRATLTGAQAHSSLVTGATDPFGEPADAPVEIALGYRGELHVGQHLYLRARDLSPSLRTFTSTDPLDGVDGTPVVANPYHYANNNPIQYTDPLGLRPSDGTFNHPAWDKFDLLINSQPTGPTLAEIESACRSIGGRMITYDGTRTCLEPPATRAEGAACWPPVTPDGRYEIVWHNGQCMKHYQYVTCPPGRPSWLEVICRNHDTIIAVTAVVGGLGLLVAGGAYIAGSGGAALGPRIQSLLSRQTAIGPLGNPGAQPFQGLTNLGTKPAAREALDALRVSQAQLSAALRAISRGTTSSIYDIGRYGQNIVVRVIRQGRDGYQVIESIIRPSGDKSVVQMAYDAAGVLVHYDIKAP